MKSEFCGLLRSGKPGRGAALQVDPGQHPSGEGARCGAHLVGVALGGGVGYDSERTFVLNMRGKLFEKRVLRTSEERQAGQGRPPCRWTLKEP